MYFKYFELKLQSFCKKIDKFEEVKNEEDFDIDYVQINRIKRSKYNIIYIWYKIKIKITWIYIKLFTYISHTSENWYVYKNGTYNL